MIEAICKFIFIIGFIIFFVGFCRFFYATCKKQKSRKIKGFVIGLIGFLLFSQAYFIYVKVEQFPYKARLQNGYEIEVFGCHVLENEERVCEFLNDKTLIVTDYWAK